MYQKINNKMKNGWNINSPKYRGPIFINVSYITYYEYKMLHENNKLIQNMFDLHIVNKTFSSKYAVISNSNSEFNIILNFQNDIILGASRPLIKYK